MKVIPVFLYFTTCVNSFMVYSENKYGKTAHNLIAYRHSLHSDEG